MKHWIMKSKIGAHEGRNKRIKYWQSRLVPNATLAGPGTSWDKSYMDLSCAQHHFSWDGLGCCWHVFFVYWNRSLHQS